MERNKHHHTGTEMREDATMQVVMDEVIDNYTLDYSMLLSRQLKDEGYTDSDYNEISDVISICDVSR